MYVNSVAIQNYKSFLDRQELKFEPGFNLLVGANNAGKTTVLDVLDLDMTANEPHRSSKTIPLYGGTAIAPSSLEVSLATNFEELFQLAGGREVYLPISNPPANSDQTNTLRQQLQDFIHHNESIKLHAVFGNNKDVLIFEGGNLVAGQVRREDGGALLSAFVQRTSSDEYQVNIGNHGGAQQIAATYYQQYKSRIYRFGAQRRPGAECGAQSTTILDREANILPYCINHLQTNDSVGHRIFCGWINRIFPSIKWVQATPVGGNFQLRCLSNPPSDRRDDLSIPLSRMGTGVGNILAILYVVLTSRRPQVIAIDEPNAFLHPRALRELLAILESEGPQHQFILTAHSAEVLTAVTAKTISLLEFDGVVTTVKQVGPKELHTLRGNLAELGIRITDLHAKDRVLWVEGQTEEMVMPQLLRFACPEIAAGTAVLRVERTGTFSKKGIDVAEVAKIYERLSASSAFVPPMICILLDGEEKKIEERQKIEGNTRGVLKFLDRRMLENYLLDAEAITAALADLGEVVSQVVVQKALSAQLAGGVEEVDGAAILNSIFSSMTESRHEFRKTRDVEPLINWLISNQPDKLLPLKICLRAKLALK